MLGLLDRQMEEVVSNGNFYKQRIEQLQPEPRELDEIERRRVGLERELVRGHAPNRAGSTRWPRRAARCGRSTRRLRLRVGELEAGSAGERGRLRPAAARGRRRRDPRAGAAGAPGGATERRRGPGSGRRGGARGRRAPTGAAATARRQELRDRLDALGYTEQAYRGARDAEAAAERARREAELALVRARGEAAGRGRGGRRRLRAGGPSGSSGSARREAVGVELALHQELDRALTDLRTELNATLRPDLSELASGFLRDLTNGRYTDLELDEDYGATLLDDGDPKAVISGGEEDVANLALRLAISQMIAERAGQPLSLLMLDEIFGSLDEERRAAVVDLLRSLADRFPQVILITHIDSVREGFDRVIRVGFDVARGCRHGAGRAAGRPRCGGLTGASAAPTGPTLRDIEPLNRVFADAFTDRYSRDGLVGRAGSAPQHPGLALRARGRRRRRHGLARRRRPAGGLQHGAPVRRRRVDGAARGAARPPGRGPRLDHGAARHRLAQGAGGAHDRAGDDAAHGGEHRVLQSASAWSRRR